MASVGVGSEPPATLTQPAGVTSPRLVIQNVTASVNVHIRLDLGTITARVKNAEYNPRKLPAVVMRIREPKVTALLFTSGKVVVTGAPGIEAAKQAARKFVGIIENLGYKPAFLGFTIQNMVATAEIGFPISLERLVYAHSRVCSYEPELFPGVIFRVSRVRVVAHIFLSGRVVLTGAKVVDHLQAALAHITPILHQYRAMGADGKPTPMPTPSSLSRSCSRSRTMSLDVNDI
ncbi:unnamed protein product [Choristocarpus tenellus]